MIDEDGYRVALTHLMHDIRPDFWVTLAFNIPHTLDLAEYKLRRLQAMVDRSLLGPRWQQKQSGRTMYIAIAEHPHSNLHFHAVFAVPTRPQQFPVRLQQAWKKLAPAGDVDIKQYYSLGASAYSTKTIRAPLSHLTFYSPNASR